MKYRSIQTKQLIIDRRYQRDVDSRRVEGIVDHFDPRQLGTLEVSARKGGKWAVFDGQHRFAALKKLKVDSAPCIAHTGLSPQEEATLFVALQRNRRTVKPLQRFKARLFAADPVAVAIQGLADELGYKIPTSEGNWNPGAKPLQAITTIERMYHKSPDGLRSTLQHALMWNGDPKATDGALLEGLFILQREYGPQLDGDAYARLAEVAPVVFIRRAFSTAVGGSSPGRRVAAEMRKVAKVTGRPRKQRREQRVEVAA